MFQKPMLKEYAVVGKGNRNTVRQPDHGLQRALNGDREALGHLFASQTPQLYRAALRILGKPRKRPSRTVFLAPYDTWESLNVGPAFQLG